MTKKINEESQKSSFTFTKENIERAKKIIARYPKGKERSAIMPLLYLAQNQNENWIPKEAMDYIAIMLSLPPMQVYEVANFYTMYNKVPVGKYLIQICRTTPCWLCGSDEITKACQDLLSIKIGETTDDGLFTLMEVECLGACVNAPMIQISTQENDHYYENLDYDSMKKLLQELRQADKQ